MRWWASTATAICLGALGAFAACSSSVTVNRTGGGDGQGAEGAGAGSTTSATGNTASASSSVDVAQSVGADVGPATVGNVTSSIATGGPDDCLSRPMCEACCNEQHPQGVMIIQPLLDCLFCHECYTSCQNFPARVSCGPPPNLGPCEAPQNMDGCLNCLNCAQNPGNDPDAGPPGACFGALDACNQKDDCNQLIQCINGCPTG